MITKVAALALAAATAGCTATLSTAPKAPKPQVTIYDCGDAGRGSTQLALSNGHLFFLRVRPGELNPGDPWQDPEIQQCISRYLQEEHDKAAK